MEGMMHSACLLARNLPSCISQSDDHDDKLPEPRCGEGWKDDVDEDERGVGESVANDPSDPLPHHITHCTSFIPFGNSSRCNVYFEIP
jgi:hypothetical protein